jgi:uncharacterized protein (DUF362 family)
VAEECLKAGAAEVIIGEAGLVDRFGWADIATLDGATNIDAEVRRLNAAYGAKVSRVCLNGDSPGWTDLESPYSGLGKIRVSSLVAQADRIISVPVIKSHRWTQITGSLKNFFGVTPARYYSAGGLGTYWRTKLHYSPRGPAQCFLDTVAALKPDLAVVDMSICCEGNGPHVMPGWWGTTVDMQERLGDWLVLASTDLVAADATAARILRQNPTDVDHIRRAYEQGLGQMSEELIEVVGADLDTLTVHWRPADQTEGFGEVLLPGLMLLTG